MIEAPYLDTFDRSVPGSPGVSRSWQPFTVVIALSCLGGCFTAETPRPVSVSPTGSNSTGTVSGTETTQSEAADSGPAWFTEVTEGSGITFEHDSGSNSEKPFPSANGSGVGALDYDLDGMYDLYFATGTSFPIELNRTQPRNRLYRNLGSWKFADETDHTGLGHNGYSAGIAVGDYDADGFPDVYVSCFGPNGLFHNQGDGTFIQVAEPAGVADERWGTSAAFFDFDNDGLLDLYVCNYAKWTWETNRYCGDQARKVRIHCSPHSVEAELDILYHNRGDGSFDDQTEVAGLAGRAGRAQGVVAADLNDDGRMDLYVGNDLHANSLFINEGEGKFRDATESSGTAYDSRGNSQAGMGVDAADYNRDGKLDLFVTNFQAENNSLYENLGNELFVEVSYQRGVAAESLPWVGWGAALRDFDLDGWPDLVLTNGHVDDNRHLLGQEASYAQPPLAWRNVNGRFEFRGIAAGDYFASRRVGRGLAVVDLDNDGDQDVVITHQDARSALLRNDRLAEPRSKSRPIVLQLIGTHGNRDGIGAVIRLITDRRIVQEQVVGGGSYLSAHDRRIAFASLPGENITRLEIRWPAGAQSIVENLDLERINVLIEQDVENQSQIRSPIKESSP